MLQFIKNYVSFHAINILAGLIEYRNYLNEHRSPHLFFYLSEEALIRGLGSFKPGYSLKNAK